MKNKKNFGFTLVEVLVVVAILGGLTVVGVPAFNSISENSEQSTCSAMINSVQTAVQKAIDIDKYAFDFNANKEVISESGILGKYIEHLDEMSCPTKNDNYIIHSSRRIYCPYHDIYSSLINAPINLSSGTIGGNTGNDSTTGSTTTTTPDEPTTPTHTCSYTEVVTTPASCTEDGVATFTCSCGDSYTEAIAAGHSWGEPTYQKATCIRKERNKYTCTVCGKNKYENLGEKDPNNHKWSEWTVVTAPTADADGLEQRECTRSNSNTSCDAVETRTLIYQDYIKNSSDDYIENIEVDNSEWVLPESNTRFITEDDINNLSNRATELFGTGSENQSLRDNIVGLALNELYARRGRKFTTKLYNDYFNSRSWYTEIPEDVKIGIEYFNGNQDALNANFEEVFMNEVEEVNTFILAEYRSSGVIHKAGEPIITATCTEAGTRTIPCADCGIEMSVRDVHATGHNYVKKGSARHICTICETTEKHTFDDNNTCTVCNYTKTS